MPVKVTIYTKPDCSLCDKAKAVIDQAKLEHDLDIDIEMVNIESDPKLRRRYAIQIPVIMIEEREAFRHRVDGRLFASAVEQAGKE